MSELIGQKVAGFHVLREIARGGMGIVFEAEQVRLGRPVALKMLYPVLTVDRDLLGRFEKEAKTLARLNHENIVNVLDFFEHNGSHFLALEFVEGETLGRRLRRCARHGRFFSLGEASVMAWQIAQALAYAHSRRVVHRDLKPDNIMLTPRGRAKVMDFGIARIVGTSGDTEVGTRIGTPDYMAPEQLRGQTANEGSDLFALGVIYYEIMAGRRPFSQADLLRGEKGQVLVLPWDESALPPGSVRARPVLERLLALDPEQRYGSAADVLEDMRERLGGEVLGDEAWVTPPRRPVTEAPEEAETAPALTTRWRRWPWWIVALAALVGFVVGGLQLQAHLAETKRKREAREANILAFMADSKNRPSLAETLFLRAITLDPEESSYWRDFGDFYYEHKRFKSAIYYYERTLELNSARPSPSDDETRRRLLDAQEKQPKEEPPVSPGNGGTTATASQQ